MKDKKKKIYYIVFAIFNIKDSKANFKNKFDASIKISINRAIVWE